MTLLVSANSWGVARTLYSFKGGNDAGLPHGGLTMDSAGNLYGTTQFGGGSANCGSNGDITGCGAVFELVKNANGSYQEKVLYAFQGGNDGADPYAEVTLDSAGNLYGTTLQGGGSSNCPAACGIVFKLTKGSNGAWGETILHAFQGAPTDGWGPEGKLILDSQGNLYGTTFYGGVGPCYLGAGCGIIFELSPTASGPWTETLLYAFTGTTDGGTPEGSLVMDEDGNFFGTTSGASAGTVFELSPSAAGWTLATLFTFDGSRNSATGSYPEGGVVRDGAGNLYGTTSCGGLKLIPTGWSPCRYGFGTVFALYPPNNGGAWQEQVLMKFAGTKNASYPMSGLIIGLDGTLWGTTYYGGASQGVGGGTTFGIVPNDDGTWSERIVARFPGLVVGGGDTAYAGVVQDSVGHLYGTTWGGGKYSSGTVYEVTP
jgi:uncharacterized repeat protein (TIGR03803 family)